MLESPFQSGRVSLGSLPADEYYQLELQYTRASNETVFAPASDQVETAPLSQDTAGRVSLDNLPYYLLGVGIVLIAGSVAYRKFSRPERGIDFDDGRAASANGPAVEGPEVYLLAELFADEQEPGNAGMGGLGDRSLDVKVED